MTTTYQQVCIHRHAVANALAALQQCKATMMIYHVKTTPIDNLIEGKERELESLILDISDRKTRIDKYKKVYFDRRTMELPREISSLRGEIAMGQGIVERKRLALIESGIEAEEANRLFPDFDGTHVLEQLKPLENELALWESFIQTGLQDDLPANIDELFERIGDGSNQPKFEAVNDQRHKLKYGTV